VNKKYVLSNSESVQCNFFIFDHVAFTQFKICCCVQNFIETGWFFAEIWRYNNFQNGGRPPSWNCFTTIPDHQRSLLLAAAACQISCQSDAQIWRYSYLNLSHIWLEMPIQAKTVGFGGLWTSKCDYSSSRLQKGRSLRKSAYFKLSTVKIRWGVWPVGDVDRKCDGHTVNLYSVRALHSIGQTIICVTCTTKWT